MKKMGLFGGTFDPIHRSHISMALRLADKLELDGVLLMPTFVPPHKIKESMASAQHRLAMCHLAAEEYPQLQVSDLELQRQGASFTADTLDVLKSRYPDTRWYLITGADMFCTLRTWYRFDDIAKEAVLCTVPRQGTDTKHLLEYASDLQAEGIECYVDSEPEQAISSTEIRYRAGLGQSLTDLVPDKVASYIQKNGLYTDKEAMSTQTRDEQFTAIIRSRLGDYRFHHSLCVAEQAERLARMYGADPKKAHTAGLLHDIMKDTPANAQLQILSDFGILLDKVEQQSKTLWHARSGEAFLRNILRIEDEDILRAVRYHTTGRSGMTLLEKVLFVADFTSADRCYDDVDEIRRLADESLDSAIQYGIDYTIRDLLSHGRPIHPDTLAAYNDIVLSAQNGG